MQNLFNPDSKLMQFLSRVGDLMILNLLFLLTSLPIFTVGAGLAAMYTVCFRFDTDREQGVIRSYFRAFRENFRQGTVLWLILAVVIGSACINTAVFYVMTASVHWFWPVFGFLAVLAVLIFSYTVPLLSQFDNTVMGHLKHALALSIGYLPRSLLAGALNVLPFVLVMTNLYVFFQVGFIWFMLYFAAAAYLNSRILKKVFAPYYEEETE